jgi:hypothetical protein
VPQVVETGSSPLTSIFTTVREQYQTFDFILAGYSDRDLESRELQTAEHLVGLDHRGRGRCVHASALIHHLDFYLPEIVEH